MAQIITPVATEMNGSYTNSCFPFLHACASDWFSEANQATFVVLASVLQNSHQYPHVVV